MIVSGNGIATDATLVGNSFGCNQTFSLAGNNRLTILGLQTAGNGRAEINITLNSGLSIGAIIGIVVGVLAVIGIVVGIIIYRKKKNDNLGYQLSSA